MQRKDHFTHIVAVDFDDCLLPKSTSSNNVVDIRKANSVILSIWKRQAERAFAATFFVSSSNRQDWAVDNCNRHYPNLNMLDDPTSSFLPCKMLAEEIGCTHWSHLLADAYSERPFGYSYARAILRAKDDTAYHPSYVFDENKFSLIYELTHLAALNMRNCDFLWLKSRPASENWLQFPFKSNAAFIYIQSEDLLLYVNKALKLIKPLDIKAHTNLEQMVTNTNIRIKNIEHDFEMLYQSNNMLIQGITLSDQELKEMEIVSGYLHIKKDWLIIFDKYDDREDILRDLALTKSCILPGNLILRLNIYSANNPNQIREYRAITGTGDIDTKPGETVVNMAKLVLQKKELTEDDYLEQHSFSEHREAILAAEFFKNRSLVKPTVAHLIKEHMQYALHFRYSCILAPQAISDIKEFIAVNDLSASTNWGGFFYPGKRIYSYTLQLLKNLLTSQTKDEVIGVVNALFDRYNQNDYFNLIEKDSDIDLLLRKIQTAYVTPNKDLKPVRYWS